MQASLMFSFKAVASKGGHAKLVAEGRSSYVLFKTCMIIHQDSTVCFKSTLEIGLSRNINFSELSLAGQPNQVNRLILCAPSPSYLAWGEEQSPRVCNHCRGASAPTSFVTPHRKGVLYRVLNRRINYRVIAYLAWSSTLVCRLIRYGADASPTIIRRS